MAAVELQRVADGLRAQRTERRGGRPDFVAMRSRFEASAPPPPADIRSITVDAARVPAEWVIAPGATSRSACSTCTAGSTSWVRSAAPLKRIDPVVICDARQAVLPTDELPPPSIPLVADRFRHTYANPHRYFAELRHTSRHRGYQVTQGAVTRARKRERVRDAAIALRHRGLYSSASHIADYSAIGSGAITQSPSDVARVVERARLAA